MQILDLGVVEYLEAWERQKEVVESVLAGQVDTLIFVEHPPVLTLGASFHEENLLLTLPEYESRGIAVHRTDRGGDVTYHGPGQLVIYPIFNLERHGKDLHRWMRDLEQTMIDTCSAFGISARRFPPHTGAWVGDLKVAAIGVKIKRWVSMHGIALNCVNDLEVYELFVPCGIRGYGVTSLSAEAGLDVSVEDAKPPVIAAFHQVFGSFTVA